MKRNAIFITCDDAYFPYAISCMNSLAKNYPEHPEILFYYDGDDINKIASLENYQRTLVRPVEFDFMDVQGLDLGVINSKAVYFRYILWTESFADYDNIMHLDADTIVLKPLDQLFEREDFFCIRDHTPPGSSVFKNELQDTEALRTLLDNESFSAHNGSFEMMNAGVFVIPKKYRTPHSFNDLWLITQKFSNFFAFADQSAISMWCHKNGIAFSSEIGYNFQAAFFMNPHLFYKEMKEMNLPYNIHILHYSWWKPESVNYRHMIDLSLFFLQFTDAYSFPFLSEDYA